MLYLMFATG